MDNKTSFWIRLGVTIIFGVLSSIVGLLWEVYPLADSLWIATIVLLIITWTTPD